MIDVVHFNKWHEMLETELSCGLTTWSYAYDRYWNTIEELM